MNEVLNKRLGTYTQIMELGSFLFTEGLSMRGEQKDRKTGENKGDN